MVNRSILRISSFASALIRDAAIDRDEALALASGADPRAWRAICQPVPAAYPASYGAAPFLDVLASPAVSVGTPAQTGTGTGHWRRLVQRPSRPERSIT